MRSYSETNMFPSREVEMLTMATAMVSLIQEPEIRCHELARVIAKLLGLTVQDGYYGFVDHSWCWTRPLEQREIIGRIGFPNILDPYSVGSLPQVRLLDGNTTSLPHIGWSYRPGPDRDDIDVNQVERLVSYLETRKDQWLVERKSSPRLGK